MVKTVAGQSADLLLSDSLCASPDLVYDGFGNIKNKNGVAYAYSGTNAGPHAVTSVGGATYTYDANGNAETGDGRRFAYTSYDMVSKISKSDTYYSAFKYGPERARWQRVDLKSGVTTTTTYLGNVERIVSSSKPDEIEWKRSVAGVLLTYKTNTANQIQSTDKRFVFTDHLGSVDVITDAAGVIRHSLSFDAWGARRSGENWTAQDITQIIQSLSLTGFTQPITTRGYTGHEMVDDMGIIHMNGRIYDAKIARFLQADPFIDGAKSTQGYNRYSYGKNNPLNGTDPSGFGFLRSVAKVVANGGIIGNVLGRMIPKLQPVIQMISGFVACTAGTPIGCAAFNAAATYANGGSFGDAVMAGAMAYMQAEIFTEIGAEFSGTEGFFASGGLAHISAHAVARGVFSVLQGGKFGHGFVSAGLTKAININGIMPNDAGPMADAIRTVIAGVVGGTVSEMTGGKFANGAITAAMAQAFNGNSQIQKKVDSMWARFREHYSNISNIAAGDPEFWDPIFDRAVSLSGGDMKNMALGGAQMAGGVAVVRGGQLLVMSGVGATYGRLMMIDGAAITAGGFSSAKNAFWGTNDNYDPIDYGIKQIVPSQYYGVVTVARSVAGLQLGGLANSALRSGPIFNSMTHYNSAQLSIISLNAASYTELIGLANSNVDEWGAK